MGQEFEEDLARQFLPGVSGVAGLRCQLGLQSPEGSLGPVSWDLGGKWGDMQVLHQHKLHFQALGGGRLPYRRGEGGQGLSVW